MKIVVIGGTGLIGRQLVTILSARGHDLIAASPSRGVDTVTGAGLADALAGAQVVIDVSNAPSFEDSAVMSFFDRATSHVVAAAKAAGVGHIVALSVVGTDRLQASGYFRAKQRQEDLIAASGLPYTIVRATQFYEFLGAIADGYTQDGIVHLPRVAMQPIAASDVAAVLAEIALAAPAGGTIEIAGPERASIAGFVGAWLGERNDPRSAAFAKDNLYFGTPIDDHSLVPGANARITQTPFDGWLATQRVAEVA